jgi:hypothetical protein
MLGKTLNVLAGIFLVVLLLSCTKLPEIPPEGSFQMEVVPLKDTIPLACGNLIAVNSAILPWANLWFQDKEGNIFTVPYNLETNKFGLNYRYLRRK